MANREPASASPSRVDALNAHRERRAAVVPPSAAMQELDRTLAGLERRLTDLGQDTPAAPRHTGEEGFPQPVSDEFDRLSESLRLLVERSSQARAQALHPLASLQDRFDEKRREAVDPALNAIEERIRKLAHSIEEPLNPQHSPSLEQDMLQQIGARLDEISRAQRPGQEDAHRLECIENRLAALADQIDGAAMRRNCDALFQKLGEVSQRIDVLSDGQALPDRVADQLAQQINLLANQVGRLMENLSRSDYRSVEARLEAISQKLEAAERSAREPHPAVLDTIDRRFAELTERLDAQYRNRPAGGDSMQTLEGRLDDISQQISLGLLQAPHYELPDLADSEAIRNLENQIANIARNLAQPSAELAQIKPRLDSIERSLDTNRETVLEAAREAAESAVARVIQHGPQGDTAIARQLVDDMKSLEALARSTDERSSRTFETVHAALVKVADRLSRLEQEIGNSGEAAGEKTAHSGIDAPQPSVLPRAPAAVENPAVTAPSVETTGKPSLFGGIVKAVRSHSSDNSLRSEATVKTEAPVFESNLAAVEPIIATGPEAHTRFGGDHMPDLNSIMKRVREERRQREDAADASLTAHNKVDFITAARRAARLATADSEQIQKGAARDTDGKKMSVGDLLHRQRKPILMAIGAVMIAMAGLQIGSAFLHRDEADVTPQPEAPAAKPAGQPTSKIAPEAPAPQVTQPRQEKAVLAEPPVKQTPVSASAPATVAIPEDAGPAALREAAAKGDARALFEIGNRYTEGRGVAADYTKAAQWYEISAGQGFAPAQYRLGNFNEKGLGMPRDTEKAKTWYERAARQGNASAMHNLAVLFVSGVNGAPDNASAARWFTQAAELGVKDSQFNLGILAAKGLGMAANPEESYKWFALAANSGDRDAAEKRDQIAATLKPEQLERASAAVRLWKPKPLDAATNSIDVPDAWTESEPVVTGSVDMQKAVRNIQHILEKNGYDIGSADGMMGARTRTAIAAFQKANGQNPTGEVDQKLVQLLLEKNTQTMPE